MSGHHREAHPAFALSDPATRGLAASLAVALLAVIFFMLAGGAGQLGPLGYEGIKVSSASIWLLAPIVGGLAIGDASRREVVRAGIAVAAALAGLLALLIVFSPRANACASATSSEGAPFLIGAVLCAGLAGIAAGTAFFVAATLTGRIGWLQATLLSIGLNLVVSWIAYSLFYGLVVC